jgi:hypothetical protein
MMNRTVMAAAIVALASLAWSASIEPAAAACRPSMEASSGVKAAEGGTKEQACARARSKWAYQVKARFGWEFSNWNAAHDRIQAVKLEGGFVKCSVQAKPCSMTVRAPPR